MNRELIIAASKVINANNIYPLERQMQKIANTTFDMASNFSKITESVNQIISVDYLESSLEAVRHQTEAISSMSGIKESYYQAIQVDNFGLIKDLDRITSNMQFNLASRVPTIIENYSQITIFDYPIISQQMPTKIAGLAYNISDNIAAVFANYQMHEQIITESEDYYYYMFTMQLEQEDNKVLFILKKIYKTRDINLIKYVDCTQTLLTLRHPLIKHKGVMIVTIHLFLLYLSRRYEMPIFLFNLCIDLRGKNIHTIILECVDYKLEAIKEQELLEYS